MNTVSKTAGPTCQMQPILIDRLPERESRIIRLRFGLDNGREQTLEEIGVTFGLTRERIRQLQTGALMKLRQMLETPEAVEVSA